MRWRALMVGGYLFSPTSTAARAKLRPRAKRRPQFGVGLADSLGAIIVQPVQDTTPEVVLLEMV
jgi:hypothetical protein